MDLLGLLHHIVDVFYKDRIYVAYVRYIKGKRLHLFLPTGREELINYSAVISRDRNKLLIENLNYLENLLKEKQEIRESLKEKFHLSELWEVVEGEMDKADGWELVHLFLGRVPTGDEVAAFMRKIVEDKIYFSLEGIDLVKVHSKEEVKNFLIQREKELERLRLLSEGKDFLSSLQSNKLENFPEDRIEFWVKNFKDYLLDKSEVVNVKFVKEILQKDQLDDPAKLVDLLARNKLIDEDWFYDLEKMKYPVDFSKEEWEEVNRILGQKIETQKYVDLTKLNTFTVDAEVTQDFDDALSVEREGSKLNLYVHITAVSSYINPHSALWNGALERALTLYLPEKVYPMFPYPLSHNQFSLKAKEIRPSLTFKFTLNRVGEILEYELIPSIIMVKKRYTYEEVDKFLTSHDPFWIELYSLLKVFKEERVKRGALAVILPEISIRVLSNGEIICEKIEMTPARDLIAEAMILANFYGSKFMVENNIPTLYRSQKMPSQIIENVNDSLYHQILQLKFMAKSELSLEPGYHSGLGLPYYTTLTSPIRRFLDMLSQYQLLNFLLNKEFLTKEEVSKILPEVQNNSQRAQYLQNKRKKYFLLKYLKKYKYDCVLKGMLLEIHGRIGKIYLPDYNLTGEALSLSSDLSFGKEINVKIEKINPYLEVLRLRTL